MHQFVPKHLLVKARQDIEFFLRPSFNGMSVINKFVLVRFSHLDVSYQASGEPLPIVQMELANALSYMHPCPAHHRQLQNLGLFEGKIIGFIFLAANLKSKFN